MKAKSIIIFFIVFLMQSCCSKLDSRIKNLQLESDSVYYVPIDSLIDFKWDELYIIPGPSFPCEVEEIIGVDYKKFVNDDSRLQIFLYKKKIVKEYTSRCRGLYYERPLEKGFVKYDNHSVLKIKKMRDNDNDYELIIVGLLED